MGRLKGSLNKNKEIQSGKFGKPVPEFTSLFEKLKSDDEADWAIDGDKIAIKLWNGEKEIRLIGARIVKDETQCVE